MTENEQTVEQCDHEEGPFHVSRSSDGEKQWYSARDDASCVSIPAKDRNDAYALVSALNRAFTIHRTRRRNDALEAMKRVNSWLCAVADCDMDEVVADGGITAGMVVQQEAKEQQKRMRAAIAAALSTPPQEPRHD